jgi:predicted RNA-binding protein with PUA-like domain
MRWLIKGDPADYGFRELERDRRTLWDGIGNALAQKHLRAMRKGDELLVYETGEVRAVVGTARVAAAPRADPADPTGKRVAVEIAVGKRLARPIPLAEIKADRACGDFALVRIGRLSVMPVPDELWPRLTGTAEG